MYKLMLLASTAALAFAPANAQTLVEDASAFGARESIRSIDLSPNGKSVAYLQPINAGGVVAYIADVETGAIKPFLKSTRASINERLDWCSFVTDTRLVCQFRWLLQDGGQIIPFARNIAINSDGSEVKQLGQRASHYDERIRQDRRRDHRLAAGRRRVGADGAGVYPGSQHHRFPAGAQR